MNDFSKCINMIKMFEEQYEHLRKDWQKRGTERTFAEEDRDDARAMLSRINDLLPIKGGATHGRAIDEAVKESIEKLQDERAVLEGKYATLKFKYEMSRK
jgi:hypothetical protein